jgi:AcrR family transcriptional regulator
MRLVSPCGVLDRPGLRVMVTPDDATSLRLLEACEQLLCRAESVDDVTVRGVAALAGTNVSAINYHFGSREQMIVLVGQRVYQRLNAARLSLLHEAVQRRAPRPPLVEDMIAALIGPSVRWSLDPKSSYPVLRHITTLGQHTRNRELYQPMVEGIEHHRLFIPYLRRVAPWLSDAEIGFRISCALGIRSQVIRQRARTEVLTNHEIDMGDAELVIANMVAVIAPMFRRTVANEDMPPALSERRAAGGQTLY